MKAGSLLMALACTLLAPSVQATHIVGGEMCYVCTDPGLNVYQITMKFYRDCGFGHASYDNVMYIGIYDSAGGRIPTYPEGLKLLKPPTDTLPNLTYNYCLFSPPDFCVEEALYTGIFILPPIDGGYQLLFQRCCRNQSLQNVIDPLQNGSVWELQIPDSRIYGCNSSACYKVFPPTIICEGFDVNFDHSAIDPDGDSLVYKICKAQDGVFPPFEPAPPPPDSLPEFKPLVYVDPPYSAFDPLGSGPPDSLTIDPVTGLLTGIPAILGQFVVAICVEEYRNGDLICTNRRDFQFNIANCDSQLMTNFSWEIDPCASDYSVRFIDESGSVPGGFPLLDVIYQWDFGDPSTLADTSNEQHPTYIYPDTGSYTVTLTVNPGLTCEDDTTFTIFVPLFEIASDFVFDTVCVGEEVSFTEMAEIVKPGVTITSWYWDYGDGTSSNDSVNTTHRYFDNDLYTVRLAVTTNNGCTDTVEYDMYFHVLPQVQIFPPASVILLGFSETLIASATEGEPPYTWLWDPTDYMVALSSTVVEVTPVVNTTYTAIAIDLNKCRGLADADIIVQPNVTIQVPTAFTPNDDGMNDVFLAYDVLFEGKGIDEIDFRVFNRWGEIVYYADNVTQALYKGWDGTHRKTGKKMEIGVYVWLLEARKLNGDKIGPLYGNVSLLR